MHRHTKGSSLLAGLILILSFHSCAHRAGPATGYSPETPSEQSVGATLWYQSSAEARALFYQAYHLARLRLLEELGAGTDAPPAVVVDIDETLLDNSPHQAKLIKTGRSFPAFWDEWIERADARPLPGSVEFLRFADSCGVAVFYVSNRDGHMLQATMRNLERHGFPQLRPERFLLRTTESSKAERRRRIAEGFNILLLIGDNLNDFSEIFEGRTVSERAAMADELNDRFGQRFIILPNPYYGDWENAVFEYRRGLDSGEKNRARVDALEDY